MGLFLANEVKSLYVGDKEVAEVYLGDKKIWPEKITFHVDLYDYHPRNGYYFLKTITFETPYKTWGESKGIQDITGKYTISEAFLPPSTTIVGVYKEADPGEGIDSFYGPENGKDDLSNEQIIDNHTYSLYYFS